MITVNAHAKINLTLDVLGTREDGYHEVDMVMQSVELADTVTVEPAAQGISLAMDTDAVPQDASNLAWKAAEAFLRAYSIQSGVKIRIEKRIPIEAGLAGGSADAAGVLVALNELFARPATLASLAALGATLGSDVPFCVVGGTMRATGRGEVLQSLPPCPPAWVVLAKPPIGVSTAWVYRTFDATPASMPRLSETMTRLLAGGDLSQLALCVGNALESVTVPAHPVIAKYKMTLRAGGALTALMSGSGPTVFAICETEAAARAAADALRAAFSDAAVFVTQTATEGVTVCE